MKRESDTIEQLRLEAGRLWDEMNVPGDGRREEYVTELIEIELELERLGLRAEVVLDSHRDDLDRCATRLDRLRCSSAVAAA